MVAQARTGTGTRMGTESISKTFDVHLRAFAEEHDISYRQALEFHVRLAAKIMAGEYHVEDESGREVAFVPI